MKERPGLVTFMGNPLVLVGEEIRTGDLAPDFVALANDLTPVALSAYSGKVVLISSVPSLDTPVCDMSTRRFNQEASSLSSDVDILIVSMDLPFAQARWCGSAGIDRVRTLSDHRDASFGKSYGVLIKELRLLSRAVFVVDRKGKVEYIEIVDEITKEPNYEAALSAVRSLL
jgi:thioredoxin-dependent peroxiredoxin